MKKEKERQEWLELASRLIMVNLWPMSDMAMESIMLRMEMCMKESFLEERSKEKEC